MVNSLTEKITLLKFLKWTRIKSKPKTKYKD